MTAKKRQKRKEVIFVLDDEFDSFYLSFYGMLCEALNKKYTFVFFKDVDDFFLQLKRFNEGVTIKGFILDMTLNPGKAFKDDPKAELGMRTGLLVHSKLRKMGFKQKIAFLTYIHETSGKRLIKNLNRRKNTRHYSNQSLFAFEFVEQVTPFLLSD